MELGRVFISSVFGGMLGLRDLAADAARLVGLDPVLTEDHVAQAGVFPAQGRLNKAIDPFAVTSHSCGHLLGSRLATAISVSGREIGETRSPARSTVCEV